MSSNREIYFNKLDRMIVAAICGHDIVMCSSKYKIAKFDFDQAKRRIEEKSNGSINFEVRITELKIKFEAKGSITFKPLSDGPKRIMGLVAHCEWFDETQHCDFETRLKIQDRTGYYFARHGSIDEVKND